jgi:hypothetical protein
MMKYFGLISTWVVAIALSLTLRGAGKLQADPTDDFSFTLSHAQETEVYRLMPESRVTQIFKDRLDLFPQSQIPRLSRHLIALCKRYRFDPAFVLSLVQVESGFHIRIKSPMGAVGLMQLMPGTGQKMVEDLGLHYPNVGRALLDPFVNLTLGVAYLAWLRDHYRGLPPYYLVAAYNVGPARMDELLSRKSFKPVNTKKYFEAIRRQVPGFRFYRHEASRPLRRIKVKA